MSYSGKHEITSKLVCIEGLFQGPSIVLQDEHGYYGFITDREKLEALRDWLIKNLGGNDGKS